MFLCFSCSTSLLCSSFITISTQSSTSATVIFKFLNSISFNFIFSHMQLSCRLPFFSFLRCLLLIFNVLFLLTFFYCIIPYYFFKQFVSTSKTFIFLILAWFIFTCCCVLLLLLFWRHPLHAPHQFPHQLWKYCVYFY